MKLGVVDVGSNTVRLLVVQVAAGGFVPVCTRKVRLRLGEAIERGDGEISELRLAAAAKAVRKLCETAREHGPDTLEVLVTAPGRQAANAAELIAALERGARQPVRVVSAEEEACLAFDGAVAVARSEAQVVGVCDLGGASTEIAVGRPTQGPGWVRSVDLGALRLTARLRLGDQPSAERVEVARAEVAEAFQAVVPPLPREALVVGGSARALRRIVGGELGPRQLAEAERLVLTTSHRAISRRFGVDRSRAPLLLAAALILGEVQRRIAVPLRVADGGVREGALLASLARAAA